MRRTAAIAWVVSVCAGCLRLSQVKTLSILVAARPCASSGGRAWPTSAAPRPPARPSTRSSGAGGSWPTERVEPSGAMKGVVSALVRKRRRKPLLVALDWVDVRGFNTLTAAAVLKGRSVPRCWASCTGQTYEGHKSRNAFEESLLSVLRPMVPEGVKVIILAGRAFGRTELARFCQRYRFSYVVRLKPDVWVKEPGAGGCEGNLCDYPVKQGVCEQAAAGRRVPPERPGDAARGRPLGARAARRPRTSAGS